ncbi:hypothetical protein H2203_000799 [Taxawa tesnikishii (nom. ined.)]|nr:hypothetical protein H2203_000799 [Dothideales sp. JES 119]
MTRTTPPQPPPLYDGAIESISEDSELHILPRGPVDRRMSSSPLHSSRNSLSIRRQRPASPLHSLVNAPAPSAAHPSGSHSMPSSASSSPSLPPTRFMNEAYPALHHYGSNSSFSSMPSTPTSARSRSPSISSLETLDEAPDLESQAIAAENERLAKLKAAAESAADDDDEDGAKVMRRRTGSLEIPRVGFGFGRRGAGGDMGRKRWSICGGERRADLDLETIWED